MNKKIIAIALALTIPLTAAAFTPGDKGGEGRHAKKMDRLTKELSLTEEQRAQLETVFKEQHEKYRAIREETRQRMQGILSEEQMTKMNEIKRNRHDKWKEKRHDKKGGKRGEAQ